MGVGSLAAIVAATIILASLTELGIFVEVSGTETFAEIEVKAHSLDVVGGKFLGGGSRGGFQANAEDAEAVEAYRLAFQQQLTHTNLHLDQHAVTTSMRVAEVFGKEHYNVMKAIKSLDRSEEFRAVNFNASKIDYQNGNIKKQLPMYYITRDGFMFLVMGFTGKTAAKWKEAYIKAFNEMEAKIRAEQMAKAIEEHDRKEAIEYEKLLEREEREEAAIDARVAAMPPAKSRKGQAEPQATEQPATTAEDGIVEVMNGKRVISSRTLARLTGRRHGDVMDSVQRMFKYSSRSSRVLRHRRDRGGASAMDKPQDGSKVSNEPPPFAGSGNRNVTEHQEGGRAYLGPRLLQNRFINRTLRRYNNETG